MSEELAYFPYVEFVFRRGTDVLVVPTHPTNHINTVEIPSREHAVAAAKALIEHYKIKQEELYDQWIACSDQMPPLDQEVEALFGERKDSVAKYSRFKLGAKPCWWRWDGRHFLADETPTHWRPIKKSL